MRISVTFLCAGALAATFCISPAAAEDWRIVTAANDLVVFIDKETLQRQGDVVTFWELTAFPNRLPYDHWRAQDRANCQSFAYQTLNFKTYAGGTLIDEDLEPKPNSAAPGSLAQTLIKTACTDSILEESPRIDDPLDLAKSWFAERSTSPQAPKVSQAPGVQRPLESGDLWSIGAVQAYKSCVAAAAAKLGRSRDRAQEVAAAALESCSARRSDVFRELQKSGYGMNLLLELMPRLDDKLRTEAQLIVVRNRAK